MIRKKIEILRKISLFDGLPADCIEKLLASINIYEKEYKKDSSLILQNTRYNALFIIVEGICEGEMIDFSGKLIKIEDFKAPYMLASASLFADDNRLPVTVKAKTDTRVVLLNKNEVLKLCNMNGTIMKNFIADVSNKFNFITKKLSFLTFKTIKRKIAYYLLSFPESETGTVTIPVTMEEMASIFGVERPSLSRVFINLESDGIIKKQNRVVTILDKSKLKEL